MIPPNAASKLAAFAETSSSRLTTTLTRSNSWVATCESARSSPVNDSTWLAMIAHALDETKRFQSPDPSVVQDLLISQKTRSEELLVRPDRAVAAARALEVTGWIVPVLLERRGVTYLDVTWVSGITGKALFSRRVALVRAESVAEQRFPWEPVPQD